jgi:excisionase family DNA binding protein
MVRELHTVDEVAELLHTTPRFVRRLIAERRIPFYRVGRHVRVDAADLEEFLAQGRVEVVRRVLVPRQRWGS